MLDELAEQSIHALGAALMQLRFRFRSQRDSLWSSFLETNTIEQPSAPRIRLRDVALVALGIPVACIVFVAMLTVAQTKLPASLFIATLYLSWLVGYQWVASNRDWENLRAKFAPIDIKPLLGGAALALGLVASMSGLAALLQRFDSQPGEIPPSPLLPHGIVLERFLFGLGTSVLAIRYRTLLPSFAMHATQNGIACITSLAVVS